MAPTTACTGRAVSMVNNGSSYKRPAIGTPVRAVNNRSSYKRPIAGTLVCIGNNGRSYNCPALGTPPYSYSHKGAPHTQEPVSGVCEINAHRQSSRHPSEAHGKLTAGEVASRHPPLARTPLPPRESMLTSMGTYPTDAWRGQ